MQAAKIIRGRVLNVSAERILTVEGSRILESRDAGETWTLMTALPMSRGDKALLSSRLLCRLFRKGVHHLVVRDNFGVLIANDTVFLLENNLVRKMELLRGSRPLAICTAGNSFFYGEYRANLERSPIHIWTLRENEGPWQIAWTFSKIRHIHGIFHDPYTDDLWVTTGDLDHEAGIWRTDNEFGTLQRIAGGSQQFRTVQLLFDREHVYFGSDAPDETNHIFRMDRAGKQIEKLTAVGSSVFYGCKVGDSLFFSTAVEPSKINTTRHTEVWGSEDGNNWQDVLRIKKDIWSMRYFQYGQVKFPEGPGDGENLWVMPLATKYDQKTIRLALKDLNLA